MQIPNTNWINFFQGATIWYVVLSSDYGCIRILNDYHGMDLPGNLCLGLLMHFWNLSEDSNNNIQFQP
jgi:hypothetical protein